MSTNRRSLCFLRRFILSGCLLWSGVSVSAPLPPDTLISSVSGGLLSINPTTGDRTQLTGASVGSGPMMSSRPLGIVREPSGDFVVADFDIRALVRVDEETGDRSIVASETVGAGGPFRTSVVAIEPGGTFLTFNIETSALERVDPVTGDRTTVASSTVGTGPVLSAVHEIVTQVRCCGALAVSDVILLDSNLGEMIGVSSVTGDRVVLAPSTLFGPEFVTPRALTWVPGSEGSFSTFLVLDSGLGAIIAFNLLTTSAWPRTVISSSAVGSGPNFSTLVSSIWAAPDGSVYVGDVGLDAIFKIDLETGDRTVFSSLSQGSGPAPSASWSLTATPSADRLAWGFESIPDGELPPLYTTFPGNSGGRVSVESSSGFIGDFNAPEGEKVLYLTTGPGDRGEPTGMDATGNGTSEFDESYLVLGVPRGPNDPPLLQLTVRYLTSEDGSLAQADPAEVFSHYFGTETPLFPRSMVAANGPLHTPVTSFSESPVTGPDGSDFARGVSDAFVYEVEATSATGAALTFRVRDELDGQFDTGMIVDNVRWVPEPGFGAMAWAGIVFLSGLRRRG